jgi:hypothetical protein
VLGHALHEFTAQEGPEEVDQEERQRFERRLAVYKRQEEVLELGLDESQIDTLAQVLAEDEWSPRGLRRGYWQGFSGFAESE